MNGWGCSLALLGKFSHVNVRAVCHTQWRQRSQVFICPAVALRAQVEYLCFIAKAAAKCFFKMMFSKTQLQGFLFWTPLNKMQHDINSVARVSPWSLFNAEAALYRFSIITHLAWMYLPAFSNNAVPGWQLCPCLPAQPTADQRFFCSVCLKYLLSPSHSHAITSFEAYTL